MMFLSDLSTATNQYILKQANVLGQTFRPKGTNAQAEARKMLQRYYDQDHLLEREKQTHTGETVMWETLRIQIVEVKKRLTLDKERNKKEGEKMGDHEPKSTKKEKRRSATQHIPCVGRNYP